MTKLTVIVETRRMNDGEWTLFGSFHAINEQEALRRELNYCRQIGLSVRTKRV